MPPKKAKIYIYIYIFAGNLYVCWSQVSPNVLNLQVACMYVDPKFSNIAEQPSLGWSSNLAPVSREHRGYRSKLQDMANMFIDWKYGRNTEWYYKVYPCYFLDGPCHWDTTLPGLALDYIVRELVNSQVKVSGSPTQRTNKQTKLTESFVWVTACWASKQ